jgi:hypothetical protein
MTNARRSNVDVPGHRPAANALRAPPIPCKSQPALNAIGEGGLRRVDCDDAEPVRMTRAFLAAPDRFLDLLLDE